MSVGARKKFKGFALIEILVALLVLSVGLLGLAGLQIRALQYAHSSYQRTLVNIQALDMAERMWTHLSDPLAELTEWRALNRQSLPNWNGVVNTVPGQSGRYSLTISWSDRRLTDSETYSFSYQLQLPVLD